MKRADWIRRAWLSGAFLICLVATTRPFGADPDTWWHLALGRLIDSSGIPASEPFAFAAAPHPWVGQQWLYEVFLSHVVAGSSGGLAVIIMGGAGAFAFLIAANLVPRRVPACWIAAGMVLSAWVSAQVMGVRGQVVTVLGAAITLWILNRWRHGNRRVVWLLPPLMLLWCNLHAGFITGFALAIAYLVMPSRRSSGNDGNKKLLLQAILVAALATLVNPAGPRLYPYVLQTFTNPVLTQNITEWQSPDFHLFFLKVFELSAVALVASWVLAEDVAWSDVVLGLGALAATLQAQRNVAVYAVIAMPQLATYGYSAAMRVMARTQTTDPGRRLLRSFSYATSPLRVLARQPVITGAVMLVLTGVLAGPAVAHQVSISNDGSFTSATYPVRAATYYSEHYGGQRLFNRYVLGGYLVYRFPQGRVVYIYGESAIFGSQTLDQYLDIDSLRPDWTKTLAGLGATHAIVSAEVQETGAFRELGWRIDCYDPAGYVLMTAHPRAASLATEAPPPPSSYPHC